MPSLGYIAFSIFTAVQPAQDVASEQALRSIKALTEQHKQSLSDSCVRPIQPGEAPDLIHEEIALRVAFFYDESGKIALRLGTVRGRVAAIYMHVEATQHRILAHACHPVRQHLERAAEYVAAARELVDRGGVTPQLRRQIEELEREVEEKLKNHDLVASRATNPCATTPIRGNKPLKAKGKVQVLNAGTRAESRLPSARAPRWARVGLGLSTAFTAIFLGTALGAGLSRLREPFQGAAHAAITDAAIDSWSGGAMVPYGEGVDICAEGRSRGDAGVSAACQRFDSLGHLTISAGILAGASLMATIGFSTRIAQSRRRTLQAGTAWHQGGPMLQLVGQF